ncbi:MAG: methyltransferase [Pseudomonadota bacterium]
MARSQGLVAQDTLATVSLKDVNRIMDVGGGSGAFLTQVGSKYRNIAMTLFDLPQVVPAAEERFAQQGMAQRLSIVPGSFRHDALPKDADCISLIRVCYDHSDATVRDLLSKVFDALPAGGRLLISEPMTGGTQPTRAGDVYFQLYTLAMRTGRTRSQAELGRLLGNVGFRDIRLPKPRRAFITSVVTARR